MTTQIDKLDGHTELNLSNTHWEDTLHTKQVRFLIIIGDCDISMNIKGNGHYSHAAKQVSYWSLLLSKIELDGIVEVITTSGLSVKVEETQTKTEIGGYPTFATFLCPECVKCPLYWSLFVPKSLEEVFNKNTSPCYAVREEVDSVKSLLGLSRHYLDGFLSCSYFDETTRQPFLGESDD